MSEIVVTMTKTGPKGGGIDGIVVMYSLDGQLHRFTVAVTFGICGTAAWDVCWGREDVADASDPSTPATTPG